MASDRARQQAPLAESVPLVLTAAEAGGERLAAVDAAAERAGLAAGLSLTDARARCPRLVSRPADPEGDRKALAALARWGLRYTPLAAAAPPDALFLDIAGCAHLFGGEAAMLADMRARLARLGYEARTGLADTAGAAWAAARSGEGRDRIVPAGKTGAWLAEQPVSLLRLAPETVEALARLGIRRVGALAALPRASLTARFGRETADRLDQALGRVPEPLDLVAPAPRFAARMAFAEPVGQIADIARAQAELAEVLAGQLAAEGKGARRFALACHRADGHRAEVIVRTGRPGRDSDHLSRLFAEKFRAWEPEFDPGFGIEVITLSAWDIADLADAQLTVPEGGQPAGADGLALARLLDRLAGQPGVHLTRPAFAARHLPERAGRLVPLAQGAQEDAAAAGGPATASGRPARPLTLLPAPEPIEITAEVPEGPPRRMIWRRAAHRIRRAEGPERIAPEWWAARPGAEPPTRDYYRLEDEAGRRFWVFREGLYEGGAARPRWFLHGLFG